MRNYISAILLSAVVGFGLTQTGSAITIGGKVDMVGSLNLDKGDLAAATAVTAFGPAKVIPTPNGAFIGTAGSDVTLTPFSWNPQSTPVTPLWSFVSGGWTYTFALENISFVSQNASFVNLAGSGTLNITGLGSPYDATPGDWTFSITSAGSDPEFRFGFVASTAAVPGQVPDGGMTLALLAPALIGLQALRRKFAN